MIWLSTAFHSNFALRLDFRLHPWQGVLLHCNSTVKVMLFSTTFFLVTLDSISYLQKFVII